MVNGIIYSSNAGNTTGSPPASTTASIAAVQADTLIAYGALDAGANATNPTNCIGGILTGPYELGGKAPLAPGLYCSDTSFQITGNLALLGTTGTWVFKAPTTITTAASSSITGGDPCNVWWRIGSQASTLGASSTFIGTIIAHTGIHFGANVTLNGRALAEGGDVTLSTDGTNITVPTGCAAPVVRQTQHLAPIIVPVIGLIKVPSPLSLPSGPGKVTYNYAVSNVGKLQRLTDISVVDDKCSPVVYSSGDINNNKLLDIDEIWNYTCSSTLTSTTTNTAIATAHSTDGYYNTAIATAIATVVVGSPIQPPLINVVKVPSQLTPFPFGGGNVTYTYTVTNPGIVAMNSITVTDDKCPSVSYVSGDTNNNNLLDTNESWIYTCKQNIKVSTGNVATAKGNANGLTALAYAFANVLVAVPSLPKTGFGPEGITISWITIVLAIAVIVLSIWLSVVLKKGKNKIKI
jgi:uncharacterized repeat protein (TIGR01451 family)